LAGEVAALREHGTGMESGNGGERAQA
jgi:hypothetical protein